MHTGHNIKHTITHKSLLALAIASALSLSSSFNALAFMQEESSDSQEKTQTEIIEVRGIADSFRNAIAEKRNANTIVDALSSADIGALPDLSVAETLERITGVTGDRFKGNASEISIRGLGPFLGFSTVNGRAISSGSGNRSVAFSQFPSELVNGVVVYKAQKADLLEGGVSGLIDLKTIKPVDYGKQRFQAELKGNYNPYMNKIEGENGWGYRLSSSYTNAFEVEGLGEIGFAIGYAGIDSSAPEESYNTSSTLRNCNSNHSLDGGSNCGFSDANAAANGGAAEDGAYYFIPNSFFYRQMASEEERDAVIFALQWQPNSDIDINLDGQWSNRYYYEDRHDLLWDDGRRRIADWRTNEDNALLGYSGESRISSYGEYRQREEEYKGLGLNIDWQVNSELRLAFDAAYSGTERYQTRTYARFRGQRVNYDWVNSNGEDWPQVTGVEDDSGNNQQWLTDIQDLTYFNADNQARDYRFDIKDTINSYKLDADYALDAGIFVNLNVGMAYSNHKHLNFQEDRVSYSTPSSERAETLANVAENCAIPFQQSDYGEDANSNITSWAQFDIFCGYNAIVGDNVLQAAPKDPSPGDIDLSEEVTSFYAMLDISTEWGEMPVDGNIGIRHVTTDVTSLNISTAFDIVRIPTGDEGIDEITVVPDTETSVFTTFKNSYDNLLPSVNLALGIHDDVQLRLAYYEGLSRPDMWYYGAGFTVSRPDDSDFNSLAEALDGNVSANGNPFLESLESKNYDISTSWFINEDTMLSAALYYKTFNARFDTTSSDLPIEIDGETITTTLSGAPIVVDEESDINGYELTALHKMDYLPGPLSGLGFSLNYNFANSNFDTPEAGGNITESVKEQIAPASIAGLSNHNFSSQFYWENKKISARLSYKYRSEYLKPFGNSLSQTNRYVDDTKTVDFNVSYKFNKHWKLKFQAINLTNEPYVEQRVAREAYNRIEYSGPRYFIGVQYRMY